MSTLRISLPSLIPSLRPLVGCVVDMVTGDAAIAADSTLAFNVNVLGTPSAFRLKPLHTPVVQLNALSEVQSPVESLGAGVGLVSNKVKSPYKSPKARYSGYRIRSAKAVF